MIIILSPDQRILEVGRAQATRYGEGLTYFKPGCLDHCADTRLTIGGYTSKNQSGEITLSPEEFVKKCEKYNLLHAVKTIDLLGCESGPPNKNQQCFAERVANILHERGYDIQVNTIIVNPKQHTANYHFIQIDSEQSSLNIPDKAKENKQSTAQTMIHLTTQFLAAKFEGNLKRSDAVQQFDKMLLSYVEQPDSDKNISETTNEDIRALLDNNEHYQWKPNTLLREMPAAVQYVIRQLNHSIAELSDAKWADFSARHQCKELTILRNKILTQPTLKEAESHIVMALNNKHFAQGNVKALLQHALNHMKAPTNGVEDDHSRTFKNT